MYSIHASCFMYHPKSSLLKSLSVFKYGAVSPILKRLESELYLFL